MVAKNKADEWTRAAVQKANDEVEKAKAVEKSISALQEAEYNKEFTRMKKEHAEEEKKKTK